MIMNVMMMQPMGASGGSVSGLPQQGDRMADGEVSLTNLTDITIDEAVVRLKEIEKENNALRDNLRQQNSFMKSQYEILAAHRKKELEKFEQTKALITALREENQELQVKLMAAEDKSKELSRQVQSVEDTKSQLMRQKVYSDQVAINVTKQAEEQGVTGLQEDAGQAEDNIVFVDTVEKENAIVELEKAIEEKDETIAQLRKQLLQSEADSEKFKDATKQLLKDMESQQKIKSEVELENLALKTQLLQTEQQRHEEIKTEMAMTKREMQGIQCTENGAIGGVLDFPENVEDIEKFSQERQKPPFISQASIETDQPSQSEIKLEKEKEENQKLRETIESLKAEIAANGQEIEDIRREAKAQADRQSMEYEQKLLEMAQQKSEQDRRPIQASETEDMSMLRSQVLFLLKEVDQTQGKLSAALEAINKKDSRISELEDMNTKVQAEYTKHWQETNSLIQNLRQQLADQHRSQMENNNVRLQYQQLQASFNKIVNDYKDLVDTFDAYKAQAEDRIRSSQAPPKQTLEEINRLTAQVIAADEALAQRDEIIQALKRNQGSATKETNDEVMAYKYQAEMYQKDFQEEREARTKLKNEKLKLEEEFKALQERNRTLTEELEGYNQRQITDIHRRLWTGGTMMQGPPSRMPYSDIARPVPQWPQENGQAVGGSLGAAVGRATGRGAFNQGGPRSAPVIEDNGEDLPSFQQFDCPTCNAQFPDLDTLQLHVPECLDKYG